MAERRRFLTRRGFLLGAGTVTVGIGLGGWALSRPPKAAFVGEKINAFVAIGEDGMVEVVCPGLEMGQGATTALPMIVAEEMGADFARLRAISAPRDAGTYGNPDFEGHLVTADSKTTRGYFDVLRLAGAQARLALIDAAAKLEGWDPKDCTAGDHAIHHRPGGMSLGFGEIARRGSLQPVSGERATAALKDRRDYRLIGTSPEPADLLAKVTGAFAYGIDRRSTGALVAVVLRAPHLRGTPIAVDDAAARTVPGVVEVVPLEDGVAVAAENTWAAIKGARALKVEWTAPEPFDTAMEERALAEALADTERGASFAKTGDADAAASGAARHFSGTFVSPRASHLAMEPLNAEAVPAALGLGVRVSGSTQSPDLDMRYAAKTWKTAPFMVETAPSPSGGAFGRRVLNDAVRDAALVAKALGRPVQVIRPMTEELRRGQSRPAALQRIEAATNEKGDLVAWVHRAASDSVLARQIPSTFKARGNLDNTSTDGLRHPYRVGAETIAWHRATLPPEPGFLRGVSAGYTVWAIETMVDRIARTAGRDPLEWRLAHIDDPRGREVLERIAEMSGWAERTEGRWLGLAAMAFRGSWVASVAELEGPPDDLSPAAIHIAANVGLPIHRGNVIAQIEGGAVFGLSLALREELRYRGGAAEIRSTADYTILAAHEVPKISVELVGAEREERPCGVGEIGVPTMAPALCNALYAATGRETDRLPVKLALRQTA